MSTTIETLQDIPSNGAQILKDGNKAHDSKSKTESLQMKRFSDCIESCKSPEEVTIILNDLALFQKENEKTLGNPSLPHEAQTQEVLSNTKYWELSNIRNLLEIRGEILSKGLERFASFSVGGSIGAGYIGYLVAKDGAREIPEVIFGASAGSLFPTLFLLWKEAIGSNPDEAKTGLEGLISYLPQNLGDKTMWSNGEELIEDFKKAGQVLIDIANRGKKEGEKHLPPIASVTIGEVSKTFGIIASRKELGEKFQEVLFAGNDNLLQAIVASSNPEVKILGIKVSVLTDKQNKFLGNIWHDGDHTNYNPINYGERLRLKNRTQVITLPFLEKESEKLKNLFKSGMNKEMDNDELSDLFRESGTKIFEIPYSGGDIWSLKGTKRKHYDANDQSSGWSIATMGYRARISYLAAIKIPDEGRKYFEEVLQIIGNLQSVLLGKDEKREIVKNLVNKLDLIYSPRAMRIENMGEWIFSGIALADTITSSTLFTNEEKKRLILSIFYSRGDLINPYLSSKNLPLFLPNSTASKYRNDSAAQAKYSASNAENLTVGMKLPKEYVTDMFAEGVYDSSLLIELYEKNKHLIPDEFYTIDFSALEKKFIYSKMNLLLLINHEPRLYYLAELIAEYIIGNPDKFSRYFGNELIIEFSKLRKNISNDKTRSDLENTYKKMRQERVEMLEKELGNMKKKPEQIPEDPSLLPKEQGAEFERTIIL